MRFDLKTLFGIQYYYNFIQNNNIKLTYTYG